MPLVIVKELPLETVDTLVVRLRRWDVRLLAVLGRLRWIWELRRRGRRRRVRRRVRLVAPSPPWPWPQPILLLSSERWPVCFLTTPSDRIHARFLFALSIPIRNEQLVDNDADTMRADVDAPSELADCIVYDRLARVTLGLQGKADQVAR